MFSHGPGPTFSMWGVLLNFFLCSLEFEHEAGRPVAQPLMKRDIPQEVTKCVYLKAIHMLLM